MKCTLLTIALVAAAGTAGAQTVSTPAGGVNAGAGAASSGSATMTTPPASAGTTTRGAQMGTSTQMDGNTQTNTNARMPAGQTNGNMDASGSAGANAGIANAPAQHPTGAAGTAQKRIERDGYKNVQNLQKGADGLWHGTAMRGNTQVEVTVDRAGRVSAQ